MYTQKDVLSLLSTEINLPPSFTFRISGPWYAVTDARGRAICNPMARGQGVYFRLFCERYQTSYVFEVDFDEMINQPATASYYTLLSSAVGVDLLWNHLYTILKYYVDNRVFYTNVANVISKKAFIMIGVELLPPAPPPVLPPVEKPPTDTPPPAPPPKTPDAPKTPPSTAGVLPPTIPDTRDRNITLLEPENNAFFPHTPQGGTSVKFTWTTTNDIKSFKIYVGLNSQLSNARMAIVDNAYTYIFTGLVYGAYYWKVKDSSGLESVVKAFNVGANDPSAPPAPEPGPFNPLGGTENPPAPPGQSASIFDSVSNFLKGLPAGVVYAGIALGAYMLARKKGA
jgi:hypothetical protein